MMNIAPINELSIKLQFVKNKIISKVPYQIVYIINIYTSIFKRLIFFYPQYKMGHVR